MSVAGRSRRRARLGLHLASLSAFAIAQPLYDILARSPEFFVAHRADRLDVVVLAFLLLAAVPGALMVLVRVVDIARPPAGTAIGLTGVFALTAAFVLMAVKHVADLSGPVSLGTAVALALAFTLAYARVPAVAWFVSVLGVGIVVFPLLFILQPSVKAFMAGPAASRSAVTSAKQPSTIVFVVFDQFPLSSLVDPTGAIEQAAYPSFAALAARSTWYRNATTVNPVTGWSVPAILTGRRPKSSDLPVSASHPDSLFTLVAPTHGLHVVEPITDLCPVDLCPPPRQSLFGRARAMLADLSIVYLHAVLPADMTRELPSVTQDWKNFASSLNWQRRWHDRRDDRRAAAWDDFVAGIGREGRPMLHYMHLLLPHDPFVYLPSGARYTSEPTMAGLSSSYRWTSDPWPVTQAYQRHLLQVAFTDALLGRLLRRLESLGMLDSTLLVVTSDHGAGFRPGGPLRNVDPTQFAAIMAVPLFIKRPFQHAGVIDDSNVETIDILPTMAEILGTSVPWPTDGRPAGAPPRAQKELSYERVRVTKRFEPASVWAGTQTIAGYKHLLFGRPEGPFRMPLGAPAGSLAGQRVDTTAEVSAPFAVRVSIDRADAFANVEPRSEWVPAYVTGTASWSSGPAQLALAVAVNGTIRATTTASRTADGGGRWSVMLPGSSFRPGANEVTVYVVSGLPGTPRLAPAASS